MEKKFYIAPEITVVTFRAERGYATSYANSLLDPEAVNEMFIGMAEDQLAQDQQPMEEYQLRSGWYNPDDGSGSFF